MDVSILLSYAMKKRGAEAGRPFAEAVGLVKDAGFRYLDYTPPLTGTDWQAQAAAQKALLDAQGMTVEQCQAPVFRGERAFDPEEFHRAFEAAALMGAKYVIVRADESRVTDRYDPKALEDFAYDYIASEADYAKKHGLCVAIENVYEDDAEGYGVVNGCSRFTSRIDELKSLIERFNDPSVGCCWNFGHAALAYGLDDREGWQRRDWLKRISESYYGYSVTERWDTSVSGMCEAMKRVEKHILCTHVSDNYPKFSRDMHLAPTMGDLDWSVLMRALREAGYQGKLSLDMKFGCMPDELMPMELAWCRATVGYLAGLFEAK